MSKSTEHLSVFDIFKIGVGPSSSHTLGPWRAAEKFIQQFMNTNSSLQKITNLQCLLYGSLAKTGVGHGTDIAVILGLMGEDPETFDVELIAPSIESLKKSNKLLLNKEKEIPFYFDQNIVFYKDESLPFHPNGLTFLVETEDGQKLSYTYYSIGGGFVIQEGENLMEEGHSDPYFPFDNADDVIHWCIKSGMSVSEIAMENELTWQSDSMIRFKLKAIKDVMYACIFRGVQISGELPGGLNVKRRASDLNNKLLGITEFNYDQNTWYQKIKESSNGEFQKTLDWISCFALAVNEENASFSRVVTAPTNGSSGVIPAVLQFLKIFHNIDSNTEDNFILTAAIIGSIFKKGATISAAMGGCQAEIGVSSAMAAAGYTEIMGGNPKQVMAAAEIAMEHHLGLTCDPIAGLVQIPCIERNTMGAIKAITAGQLALMSNPYAAKVSLDAVVNTMWETALDMNSKYKETSDGGLAIKVPLGLSEC